MPESNATVLLIDDNPDILSALKVLLEANGYEVRTAASAKDGIEVYRDCSPDFILVDLMMEDIDAGEKFAADLRGLNNTAPVYLLSSAGDAMAGTTDYTQLGFSGVLQKPCDHAALLKLIADRLHKPA